VVGRISNNALVRESDPRQQRTLLVVLLVVLGLALPVLFYVWQHNRYVALTYEVQELRKSLDRSREQRQVYRARIEELSSPSRVKRLVSELRLGLVPPGPDTHRVIRTGPPGSGSEGLAPAGSGGGGD
jgi:hypothetical protein